MSNRRITLSQRERYVLAKIIAYMTHKAAGFGDEGKCLVEIGLSELTVLRAKIMNGTANAKS